MRVFVLLLLLALLHVSTKCNAFPEIADLTDFSYSLSDTASGYLSTVSFQADFTITSKLPNVVKWSLADRKLSFSNTSGTALYIFYLYKKDYYGKWFITGRETQGVKPAKYRYYL